MLVILHDGAGQVHLLSHLFAGLVALEAQWETSF